MLPFWLQATANPPFAEADVDGLAQGSFSMLTRNSSPRGLPSASNMRLKMSAVYRGAEFVTTTSPEGLIGAVVCRSLTQARTNPPPGRAATEGDRWLKSTDWLA